MKAPIQLLVTLDENYLPPLRVMLKSVFIAHPKEGIDIWLLHRKIPKEKLEALAAFCERNQSRLHAIQVAEDMFADAPTFRHFTRDMYFRLLSPQLLPTKVKRVLYLDPDTLVINSLRPLWELDLEGAVFAGASHLGKTDLANEINKVRLRTEHPYYNSGVLLLDLEHARTVFNPKEIFAFTKEHAKAMILPDQDILNSLYGAFAMEIKDVLWNYDARNYMTYLLRSNGEATVEWVIWNTAVLHFCGGSKPWNPKYPYRFGMLYQHYMRLAALDEGNGCQKE